jgi:hypothetical protein
MTKPRRRQAGEGAIFEYQTRAGLRYAIKWREQQEDGTERQVLRRTTRAGQPMTTRKQAAEELGSILVKIREGAYVTPSKITTGQWLAEWLKGLRVAPSTRSSYAKNIRLHLVPTLGQVPLARLTGAKIDGLYRDLERSGRQDHASGDGLSARTVRYIHTILKAALREAVAQGLLVSNPADKAHPPSAKEARPPEMHPWKAEQLATFLGWASEHGCADLMACRCWHSAERVAVRCSRCVGATSMLSGGSSAFVARSGSYGRRARVRSWSRAPPRRASRGLSNLIDGLSRRCAAIAWPGRVWIFG